MKNSRKVIAIMCGIFLSLGYLALGGPISEPRIMVGLIFGFVHAFTLIRHPEQLTRSRIIFMGLLLMAFVIFEAIHESEKLILLTIWALLLLGSHAAFLMTSFKNSDGQESTS